MPATRRTRIVCISDTHNTTPKLPAGDILIHAGDLTNQGSYSELSKAVKWLESAKFEAKIVIAGNHDMTLDPAFYAEHGSRVHNQAPQSHEDCLSLLTSAPGITYLNHESTTVRLASPSGPRTELRVFGSPYSLRCSGLWGFQYDPDAAAALWDVIPSSIDVVITHGPSRSHLDDGPPGPGCEVLRRRLSQVRPVLAVCGHVHAGRGAEHVTWADDDSRSSDPPSSSALSVNPDEASVTSWDDPSPGFSGKMSLVDLTGRKQRGLPGPPPLGTMTSDGSPGRRQTCLVNAAIMRSSYPHIGGKQLNKPIVVDVELPMWEASEP